MRLNIGKRGGKRVDVRPNWKSGRTCRRSCNLTGIAKEFLRKLW